MLASAALSAPTLWAVDQPELDADFLEFLGSIDAEAAGWSEYLERTEIARVAVKPVKPPVVRTPTPAPTAATKPPATKPPQVQSK
jgi:hypothetical protein